MATFDEFLSSLDPETKGKQFEHFVKWFLQNDPEWKTQVDQIWLWDQYLIYIKYSIVSLVC
jgi:predicted helicase